MILYMTHVLNGPQRHLPCYSILGCFPYLPVGNESDRHYKGLKGGFELRLISQRTLNSLFEIRYRISITVM
jgi:hypothetical protein